MTYMNCPALKVIEQLVNLMNLGAGVRLPIHSPIGCEINAESRAFLIRHTHIKCFQNLNIDLSGLNTLIKGLFKTRWAFVVSPTQVDMRRICLGRVTGQ